jgi:sarcosine oxidase subunit delta
MLLIPCPYCGARPELEFRYAGQAHIARPLEPAKVDDVDWAGYLYGRDNVKGIHAERWRHIAGCGRFFNCLRDTLSDAILVTYRCGEARPDGAAEAGGLR